MGKGRGKTIFGELEVGGCAGSALLVCRFWVIREVYDEILVKTSLTSG